MDITNVTLVEIVEDRVVVLDGKEYLVVDKALIQSYSPKVEDKRPENNKAPIKKKSRGRPTGTKNKTDRYDGTEARKHIIDLLGATPNQKNADIFNYLNTIGCKITSNQLRGVLQRMKQAGQIKVEGEKINATWSLVDQSSTPSWMVPKT